MAEIPTCLAHLALNWSLPGLVPEKGFASRLASGKGTNKCSQPPSTQLPPLQFSPTGLQRLRIIGFILLLPRIHSHRDPYALSLQFPFTESSFLFRSRSTFGLKATDLLWSPEELVMHPGQQIISYIRLETQPLLLLLRALEPWWELRLPGAGAPLWPWGPPSRATPVKRPLSPSLPTSARPGQGHTFPRPSWPWSKPRDSRALVPSTLWQRSGFYFQQQNKNCSQWGSVPHGSIPPCLYGTAESYQRVFVPGASAGPPLSLCCPRANK